MKKLHFSKRVNLLPFGVARVAVPACGSDPGRGYRGVRVDRVTCKRCLKLLQRKLDKS